MHAVDVRVLARLLPISAAALTFLVAGSCEDDPTPPEAGTGTLRIVLDQTADGEPLVMSKTHDYTTAEGNAYRVSKLVYILSLIEVESEDSHDRRRHAEGPEVHLRDAFDDASRTIEITDAPEGEYTALTFVFGLNEEMNGPGITYSQPGFENAWIDMDWQPTWGDGYHYMKLEGFFLPDGGGLEESLLTHLGRRNAQGDQVHGTDPEPIPHFFTVDLPFPEPVTLGDGQTIEIQVLMDVANWYTGPNDIDLDDETYARMIMMRTPVQTAFEANGKDETAGVFSLGTITQVD